MVIDNLDLLTVQEVAEFWRVSTMTVYRIIKAGEIQAIRVGKNFRIPRTEVARYLERNVQRVP